MMVRKDRPPPNLFVSSVGVDGSHVRPPVVFLHGLGGTGRYWTAANGEPHLPPGATLVDLYGFGRSPRPFRQYTVDTHMTALESVLATGTPSVVDGPVVVGHSLGAALAVAYAARHPEQVSALVLIGLPSYGGKRGAVRWLRHGLKGWFLTNMALTAVACVITRRLLGPVLPSLIRDVPRQVAKDLVEHNLMSSTTSLWNVVYRYDVAADLAALPDGMPVTFIHGTDDATAPVEPIRELADTRPHWQLIELEGVDHHPWLRDPARCAASLPGGATGIDAPESPRGGRSPAPVRRERRQWHRFVEAS